MKVTMAIGRWLASGAIPDDRTIFDVAGIALPVTVWLLGIVLPPRGGLTPAYLLADSALLVAIVGVDRSLPSPTAPSGRRALWLAAELILCLLVVGVQGNLTRTALVYLLPASRALLMFRGRVGMFLSLAVWAPFSLNVVQALGLEKLGELPTYLTLLAAPYIVAVILTRATLRQSADRQRLQALFDRLQQAHRELQALHQKARETAVAEERNRLAREIHDSIAHYLTVVNLQLEAAEKLGTDQPARASEQVRRARRLTLECLQEVRRSVAALRAASLEELALPRALDKLVGEFAETTGIQAELDVALADQIPLPPETSLALYRVAQEGLTNVQRHARARHVSLTLERRNGDLVLAVRDDGVGPGADDGKGHAGFGLLGLRERVELLGGQLTFGAAAPRGSRLAATVPLRDVADRAEAEARDGPVAV
jgi:signal transduction histidine kinase